MKKFNWETVETIPRDGSFIDIFTGNSEFPARHSNVSFREMTDEEWWSYGDDGEDKKYFIDCLGYKYVGSEYPTHWIKVENPEGYEDE